MIERAIDHKGYPLLSIELTSPFWFLKYRIIQKQILKCDIAPYTFEYE